MNSSDKAKNMLSDSLSIKRIGGSGRSSLKLQGTVLIYNEKNWFHESTLLLPVESVCISELARFYRDLIIWALLIPLITTLLVITLWVFVGRSEGIAKELVPVLVAAAVVVTLVLECGLLIALLMQFLFTKKSVCLTIESCGLKIEFWKERKIQEQIDAFLEKIREQQTELNGSLAPPSEDVFKITDVSHIRRLIPQVCLFCIPSVVLEMPALLLLGLAPIGWYLYQVIQLRTHPKQFRQAVVAYRRKNWEVAIGALKDMLRHYPEYIPAMLLLVEIYVRTERFDEALETATRFPEEYLNQRNAMYSEIWKWKRIHLRRMEPVSRADTEESL